MTTEETEQEAEKYPRIFMQWHGDGDPQFPLPDHDAVTWCINRINASDVEYLPVAELTALRAHVAKLEQAGDVLATIAFNLKQRSEPKIDREVLDKYQRAWDAARKTKP